jgi:hypothetical protein
MARLDRARRANDLETILTDGRYWMEDRCKVLIGWKCVCDPVGKRNGHELSSSDGNKD